MSHINEKLKTLTKEFVQMQEQVDDLLKQLNEMRQQKRQVETALVDTIKNAGLASYGITYQGNKLYIGRYINYDAITFKFLETCLLELYKNDTEKVGHILKFIKQKRSKKESQVIKLSKLKSAN